MNSMWSLIQIATFDDWSSSIMLVCVKKPMMLVFFSLWICIAGLGILNLIVGIMCNSAMIVSTQDDEVLELEARVSSHKAAISLRRKLLELHDADHTWTFKELIDAIAKDKRMKKELKESHIT